MTRRETVQERLCAAVERRREQIVGLGADLMDTPELGFREERTAARVCTALESLGLTVQQGLAITGLRADLHTGKPGPRVALLGELDAVRVPEHPHADPHTGAAHACGHNAQLAGLVGAAMALSDSAALEQLAGSVALIAVPAEEYVEIEYRLGLAASGRIEFLSGKPELLRLGVLDDVDMALMIHTSSSQQAAGPCGLAESFNGFLAKRIRFVGRAAHAGAAPQRGINALNAAMLALEAIHAQRETFRDEDHVRVHPILTRGGDLVNVVPADVRLETYVRGRTWEAIADAALKVDRAARGASVAVGGQAIIDTVPGYLPLCNDPTLARIFRDVAERLFGAGGFQSYPHSSGSTDAGDLSQVMPFLHPSMAGATGTPHGADWAITDVEMGYVAPAKALAMMVADLLEDGAAGARRVLAEYVPQLSRDQYLERQRGVFQTERFDGTAVRGRAVATHGGIR